MTTLATTIGPSAGAEEGGRRVLGLSDAVFAIAMTLLALDLRVPELGEHPSDSAVIHALLGQGPHYLAFLLSFYVIAGYWQRHGALMRAAGPDDRPVLVRRTLSLLLAVSALPFAADLLGTYGGQDGIAIVVYVGVNMMAVVSLLLAQRGSGPGALGLWFDLAALAIAAPAGYLFHGNGPLVMAAVLLLGSAAASVVTRVRAA